MEHLRLSSFCDEASEQRQKKNEKDFEKDKRKTKAAILGVVGFFKTVIVVLVLRVRMKDNSVPDVNFYNIISLAKVGNVSRENAEKKFRVNITCSVIIYSCPSTSFNRCFLCCILERINVFGEKIIFDRDES